MIPLRLEIMKRIGLIILLSLCVVPFALAQTTSATVNLPPGGRWIFGMNYEKATNGDTNTLLSIFGTNQLKKDINYLGADRISLWSTAQSRYQTYAMRTNGLFYPCNNMTEWNTSAPANPVIPLGTGMWLVRGYGVGTFNSITVTGQIVMAATQQVAVVPGYQIIAYPFSSSIAISNINTTGMTKGGYSGGTRLVTWENDAYQWYGLYTDGRWYKCNTMDEWIIAVPATHTIQVGEGFFFLPRPTDYWIETRPYPGN
jgi:hypothetical protein